MKHDVRGVRIDSKNNNDRTTQPKGCGHHESGSGNTAVTTWPCTIHLVTPTLVLLIPVHMQCNAIQTYHPWIVLTGQSAYTKMWYVCSTASIRISHHHAPPSASSDSGLLQQNQANMTRRLCCVRTNHLNSAGAFSLKKGCPPTKEHVLTSIAISWSYDPTPLLNGIPSQGQGTMKESCFF